MLPALSVLGLLPGLLGLSGEAAVHGALLHQVAVDIARLQCGWNMTNDLRRAGARTPVVVVGNMADSAAREVDR